MASIISRRKLLRLGVTLPFFARAGESKVSVVGPFEESGAQASSGTIMLSHSP
jgi:hypothetical protein